MILKVLGAILIILSSFLLGYLFSRTGKYRLEDLEEMKKALTILKGKISFARLPLPCALEETAHRCQGMVAAVFMDTAKALEQGKTQTAQQAWEAALEQYESLLYFGPEDREALYSFGRSLGSSDAAAQLDNISITVDYIERTQKNAESEAVKTAKIYQSMGILWGILFAVILL